MSEGFKNCPYCGRLVVDSAVVCKHCGERIGLGGGNKNNARDDFDYSQEEDNFGFAKGFTYMFTDKNFIIKFAGLVILTLLLLLPYISLFGNLSSSAGPTTQAPELIKSFSGPIIIGMLVMTVLYGYFVNCIKNISQSSEIYNLPVINLFSDLWAGIKLGIAVFLFFIPLGIIMGIGGMILGALAPVADFVGFLIILFLMPMFWWIFAQKRYWTAFFKWGFVAEILCNDLGRYSKALWFVFVSGLLIGIPAWIIIAILAFLLKANLIVLSVFFALFGSYMSYVAAFYIAKSISADRISNLP